MLLDRSIVKNNLLKKNLILSLLCLLVTACVSTDTSFKKQINTAPSGATIAVNGNILGESPVVMDLDKMTLRDIEILASKEGYFNEIRLVNAKSLLAPEAVYIKLNKSPVWEATVETPVLNQWLILSVDNGESSDQVWSSLISILSERYGSIKNIDYRLGSADTDYVKRRFETTRGLIALRSRILIRRTSLTPLVYKIKLTTEWSHGIAWQQYNRAFVEDERLIKRLFKRYSG